MKRFYCQVCKRIKRVRKYPQSVKFNDTNYEGTRLYSDVVSARVGECSWHKSSKGGR